ncbi:MAG: hypothetical protein ACE5HD_07220 [Acidobacteriota bacterium]
MVAAVLWVAVQGLAHSQDAADPNKTKGRFWDRIRLGATAGFLTGVNEIRSESANVVSFRDIQVDPMQFRFEPRVIGDPGQPGTVTLSPVTVSNLDNLVFRVPTLFIRDPRRDEGSLQDNAVESNAWVDLDATYDIKTWRQGTLIADLSVGYFKGEVGSIEVAVDIAEEGNFNPTEQDFSLSPPFDPLTNFQFIFPRAGTITQVPISLSGVWQFRPRSSFRPYIGLGLGWMNVNLESSSSLELLNEQLSGMPFSWTVREKVVASGILPPETITVDTISDVMYVAQGGLEYNVNRKWSVFFTTKFISTNARVQIRELGFVNFGEGIGKSFALNDVDGIGTREALVNRLLSLSVEDAKRLIDDITEGMISDQDPSFTLPLEEDERAFNTSFPVELGTSVRISVPNPIDPGNPNSVTRRTKLFVQGGDVQLDALSIGFGFRYRY